MVAANGKTTISWCMKMMHNSNFSVQEAFLERSHTLRDLPWLLLQPPEVRLWPPLSLLQPHWPLRTATAKSGLCLPHFLQGSAQRKRNQRGPPATHPSVSPPPSWFSSWHCSPATRGIWVPWELKHCLISCCIRHSTCSINKQMNCHMLGSAKERQGRAFRNRTSQPVKTFMMRGASEWLCFIMS